MPSSLKETHKTALLSNIPLNQISIQKLDSLIPSSPIIIDTIKWTLLAFTKMKHSNCPISLFFCTTVGSEEM